MLPHLHFTLAQGAGNNGFVLCRDQIGGWQAAKQCAMQHHRIQGLRALQPGIALLQRLLCLNVRHGQALLGSQHGILRKVLAQRLLDLVRARVLALDAVGVVRVHAAQQQAQLGRHPGACQQCGGARQIVRLGQQRLHTRIGWKQGLELMGRGVHDFILPTLNSL